MFEWYLIRTKAGKERKVRERLDSELSELFLPLFKIRTRRREKLVDQIVPLFPCYLFGQFDVESQYRRVRYTPGIREVLSEHSNWPTIPQLFVDGTLVGGCDVVTEMAQTGELAELISTVGR